MRLQKRPQREDWSQQLSDLLALVLTQIHHGTACALGYVARGMHWVLERTPLRARMALLMLAGVVPVLLLWRVAGQQVLAVMARLPDAQDSTGPQPFRDVEELAALARLVTAGSVLAALCAAGALLALWRQRLSLVVMRLAAGASAAVWVLAAFLLDRLPRALHAYDKAIFDKPFRDELWVAGFLFAVPAMFYAALTMLAVSLRAVREHYTGDATPEETAADRLLKNLQTHGDDPRYRTSNYWATFLHVAAVILPFVLMWGCLLDEYNLPPGSGTPAVAQAVRIKPIKPKKVDKVVLNMNSPIIYYRPDIDESKIDEEIEEMTRVEYEVTAIGAGKLGKGGGKQGGWPFGKDGGMLRFIRLEYGGGDWYQDMGQGADYNFLIEAHNRAGIPIAKNTEHIPVSKLRRFKKNAAPPFVFITGRGAIHMTKSEIETLRWYLLEEGGMLFADCGGGAFGHHFRNLMKQVLPGKPWIDIPNDDIIYREPYTFPNGAPSFWHHDGTRALGMKHGGRWVVFYHPGDINDLWKEGSSGANKHAVATAHMLGINVVYYAFNQYHKLHFEQ